MNGRQKPRPASTVILVRQAAPSGVEVFLTRRPQGMAFLGGMYCFPGGTVRKEDSSPAMVGSCYGLTPNDARKILGAHLKPDQALSFWVAAVREVFEEAGVLFAVGPKGRDSTAEPHIGHLPDAPHPLLGHTTSFHHLLERAGLMCDASRLAYFSHWLTPPQFPMRFDTRFFLAALPQAQTPLPSSPEVAHSLWITPDRALRLFAKEQLPMIFPTFASLRTLADFDSSESLFREFPARKPVAGSLE